MRAWQFWWRTLVLSTQSNPPEFVEYVMVSLATALLVRCWYTPQWPFLVLSSSLAFGAAVSMWVREIFVRSPRPCVARVMPLLLLIYSFFIFTVIIDYL